MKRPIQIGVSILELSKLIMYQYYFDVLKKTFGPRIKLLYTDTDSYIVQLYSKDLLQDLKSISSTLDTSEFPKSNHILSELHSKENASELFYFKSEVGAESILAFVAIRAKVYSLIHTNTKNGEELLEIISKLKGVNHDSVEALGFYKYLLCIILGINTSAKFVKLASKGHHIEMQEVTKSALKNFGEYQSIIFFLTIFTSFIQMIK